MDIFNSNINNLDNYSNPTDITFTPSGTTALTLSSTAATFTVPLVGDGSGLTGVTGGGNGYHKTYQIINSNTLNEQLIPNALIGALGAGGLTANRCYMIPFCLGMDYTVTKLAVEVTTAAALATAYMGIYELDSNFVPLSGAPLVETGALTCTTTGLKTGVLASSQLLTKDTLYGISIISTVGISIRCVTGYNWFGGAIGIPSMKMSINELISPGYTSMPTSFNPTNLGNGVTQFGLAMYRN